MANLFQEAYMDALYTQDEDLYNKLYESFNGKATKMMKFLALQQPALHEYLVVNAKIPSRPSTPEQTKKKKSAAEFLIGGETGRKVQKGIDQAQRTITEARVKGRRFKEDYSRGYALAEKVGERFNIASRKSSVQVGKVIKRLRRRRKQEDE